MSQELNDSSSVKSDASLTNIDLKNQSSQDVSNMTNKDIKFRAKYKETLSELESLKASESRRQKETDEKISLMEKAKDSAIQKRIDAEIKAAAVNAGLTDLDLIKLIDRDKISIDNTGEPIGISDVVNAFKELKPAYFTEAKKVSSSTNSDLITKVEPVKTSAWDLTDEEFKAKMKQLGV